MSVGRYGISKVRTDFTESLASKQRYKIFERIDLELLARHSLDALDAVAEKLTNRTLFDDVGVRPEYYALSEKAFGSLHPTQREQILKWIDEGLSRKSLQDRGFSQDESEDPTQLPLSKVAR